MAIDAEAARRSRYAATIRNVLARHELAEVVDPPIERIAVALDDTGSTLVTVRSSEPIPETTALTERVSFRAEGDYVGVRPRHACATPGEGWFFLEASPSTVAAFGMLDGIGFPRPKRLTMDAREYGSSVVVSARLSFEGAIELDSTITQSFLRGVEEEAQRRVPARVGVAIEENQLVLRFVAESEPDVDRLLDMLATTLESDGISAAPAPYRTDRVVPASPIPATQGANFGTITLAPGFVPDPAEFSGSSGGPVDASTWAPSCVGFVSAQPDHVLVLSAPARELAWMVRSADDVTLVVELPTGELLCNDDYEDQDPLVVTENLPAGTYRIWVGSFAAGANHPYTLGISELASTVPSSLTPP